MALRYVRSAEEMGISFASNKDYTLTKSQRRKAKELGITEDEMIERLIRIQNREKPIISIIIPVYNCEKYIRQSVESALKQTYHSFEVIVVDDGSTDGTLDIITEYENVTVLIKPNGGTASALNTGIRNAKGIWIKWLSADDVLKKDYLSNIMKTVTITDAIYYTNYDIIGEDGNVIKRFTEPELRNFRSNEEQFEELMKYYYGNGSSSLIHKSVFEKVGLFDESLPHSEDYEFWLRASKNNIRFVLIPNYDLEYRRHPDQLTNKVGGSLDMEIKKKYV
jgi:teichuronic acid biosynthesis glycosyltransferase TuaG